MVCYRQGFRTHVCTSRPLFIIDTGLRLVKNPKPSLAKRYKLLKQSPEANSSLLRDFEFA